MKRRIMPRSASVAAANINVAPGPPGETTGQVSRTARLAQFYQKANVELLGEYDYTLVSPLPSSILISDENDTVGSRLFGYAGDDRLRSLVIKIWLPTLLFQFLCVPIGMLILTGHVPPVMAFLTMPGGIFPLLLILRSHWQVMKRVLNTWESVFLAVYSTGFCISITMILTMDFRGIFIWSVIFPALIASTFADASAVRLDHGFIKGHLSMSILGLPPYIVSISFVFTVMALLNTKDNSIGAKDLVLTIESPLILARVRYSTMALSMGMTIALFLLKSIYLIVRQPDRCVALRAPMAIDIASLKPPDEGVDPNGRGRHVLEVMLSGQFPVMERPKVVYRMPPQALQRAPSMMQKMRRKFSVMPLSKAMSVIGGPFLGSPEPKRTSRQLGDAVRMGAMVTSEKEDGMIEVCSPRGKAHHTATPFRGKKRPSMGVSNANRSSIDRLPMVSIHRVDTTGAGGVFGGGSSKFSSPTAAPVMAVHSQSNRTFNGRRMNASVRSVRSSIHEDVAFDDKGLMSSPGSPRIYGTDSNALKRGSVFDGVGTNSFGSGGAVVISSSGKHSHHPPHPSSLSAGSRKTSVNVPNSRVGTSSRRKSSKGGSSHLYRHHHLQQQQSIHLQPQLLNQIQGLSDDALNSWNECVNNMHRNFSVGSIASRRSSIGSDAGRKQSVLPVISEVEGGGTGVHENNIMMRNASEVLPPLMEAPNDAEEGLGSHSAHLGLPLSSSSSLTLLGRYHHVSGHSYNHGLVGDGTGGGGGYASKRPHMASRTNLLPVIEEGPSSVSIANSRKQSSNSLAAAVNMHGQPQHPWQEKINQEEVEEDAEREETEAGEAGVGAEQNQHHLTNFDGGVDATVQPVGIPVIQTSRKVSFIPSLKSMIGMLNRASTGSLAAFANRGFDVASTPINCRFEIHFAKNGPESDDEDEEGEAQLVHGHRRRGYVGAAGNNEDDWFGYNEEREGEDGFGDTGKHTREGEVTDETEEKLGGDRPQDGHDQCDADFVREFNNERHNHLEGGSPVATFSPEVRMK